MPIKSFVEKKISDLIMGFLENNLHKNTILSVVTQNIKKGLFNFCL